MVSLHAPPAHFCLGFVRASVMPESAAPVLDASVLGRSPHAQINIYWDKYVNRWHCRFEVRRDNASTDYELYVEDLGSLNGTYVNNKRIPAFQNILLKAGSSLTIGRTELIVVRAFR